MGIEYQVRMVCDRCGKIIEPWIPQSSFEKIRHLRWDWKRKHSETGVMIGLPNRYGKYSIYCQPCADGAKPAIHTEKQVA